MHDWQAAVQQSWLKACGIKVSAAVKSLHHK